jgi:hypothetical protein
MTSSQRRSAAHAMVALAIATALFVGAAAVRGYFSNDYKSIDEGYIPHQFFRRWFIFI